MVLALLWAGGVIAAELPKEANKATIECPDVGQPCKVLLINSQEENLLIRQGGILDTASAGRYIELGNVVSYFRMKLMQAPQGEVKQPPVPEKKPAAPQAVVPPAN